MLGKMGAWRHVVVASSIVGVAVLAATGVIGRGPLPERFESKVVTVTPSGTDGVRIREVVDQDFGAKSRYGYERIIPTDFGSPIDIEASSPDANADVGVASVRHWGPHSPGQCQRNPHRAASVHPLLHAARRPTVDRPARPRHHR